jgi:hypothetical protein
VGTDIVEIKMEIEIGITIGAEMMTEIILETEGM